MNAKNSDKLPGFVLDDGDAEGIPLLLSQAEGLLAGLESSMVRLERGGNITDVVPSARSQLNEIKRFAGHHGLARVGLLAHHLDGAVAAMNTRPVTARRWVLGSILRAVTALRTLMEGIACQGHDGDINLAAHLEELQRLARMGALEPKLSIPLELKTGSHSPLDSLQDILETFIEESTEQLDLVSRHIEGISGGRFGRRALDETLRCFHTIKGVASILNLKAIETLSHAAEALLVGLRDRGLIVNSRHGILLSEAVKLTGKMLARLENGHRDSEVSYQHLVDGLRASSRGGLAVISPLMTMADEVVDLDEPTLSFQLDFPSSLHRVSHSESGPSADLTSVYNQLVNLKERLESNGESDPNNQTLSACIADLGGVIDELSKRPIDSVISKTPRLLQGLAKSCGKAVQLKTVGTDIPLDKPMLTAVSDILTPLIRNALRHGIEEPLVRIARDKNVEGVITVRAEAKAEHLVLKVEDDGAGVDLDAVRAVGIEAGLLSVEDAVSRRPGQLLDLLTRPGFTTVSRTDRLSGRGVGLDIVRSQIEAVGGTLQMTSLYGQGAAFIATLPWGSDFTFSDHTTGRS
jgi:two-component system chemotaxis sensor kinase CheA